MIDRQKADGSETSTNGDGGVVSGGLVMLNGTLINIDNILSNLSKSEKTRLEMELKLKAVEDDCSKYTCTLCILSTRALTAEG